MPPSYRNLKTEEMDQLTAPLMTKLIYNFEAGSTVVVRTHNNGDFEGQVYINPAHTSLKNSIKLVNIVTPDGKKLQHHTWFQNEIKAIKLVKAPTKFIPKPKELVMSTVIIKNVKMLSNLVQVILEEAFPEVGCFFPGLLTGRLSTPESLILNVNNTLVVIPLNDPTIKETFWEEFGKQIFANYDVVKVFFNSRSATDYIFHVHGICVNNRYDLKEIEHSIREQKKRLSSKDKDKATRQPESIKLTDLLQTYLPNLIPQSEYDLLNAFSEVHPDQRPESLIKLEKKYFALKVKYLLQLKNEMEKRYIEPITDLVQERNKKIIQGNGVELVPV